MDVRPTYAERAGGQGDRYKVIVDNRERYLYFEHSTAVGEPVTGRWFVEPGRLGNPCRSAKRLVKVPAKECWTF